ncbi:cupin domain-containing protein [Nitrospira sp. Kam-Ns4a]
MVIKHYTEVKPDRYTGVPEGVQVREMITGRDGAPNFALRVFDVEAGASTPFHDHPWEHEVFIVSGTGLVRSEGGETPFRPGDSVFIPAGEKHCFAADASGPARFICVIPTKNACTL